MSELHAVHPSSHAAHAQAASARSAEPYAFLRAHGARAHQLRTSLRAADHYLSLDTADDRVTAAWLVSCALGLAAELSTGVDKVAKSLRDRRAEPALQHAVAALRQGACQLHAVTRAADHFLEQGGPDDRDVGSWLISTAHWLAQRLASDLDDHASPPRQVPVMKDDVTDSQDVEMVRRIGEAVQVANARS